MGQRDVGFPRHLPIAYALHGAVPDCSRTAPALRPWAVLFLRRLPLGRAAVRFARHRKCSDPPVPTGGNSPTPRSRSPNWWKYFGKIIFTCGRSFGKINDQWTFLWRNEPTSGFSLVKLRSAEIHLLGLWTFSGKFKKCMDIFWKSAKARNQMGQKLWT